MAPITVGDLMWKVPEVNMAAALRKRKGELPITSFFTKRGRKGNYPYSISLPQSQTQLLALS
jgi:hypothetical protein